MRKTIAYPFAFWVLILAHIGYADTPPRPPEKFTVDSPDGQILAISDPDATTTKITRSKDGSLLWEIPGWETSLFVANDGKHVVTGYRWMNLIPLDYDEQMVVFTFWREGTKIKEVTLREFIKDKSPPVQTASHYQWGWIEKIDTEGFLVVRDSEFRKSYRYSMETGSEVK